MEEFRSVLLDVWREACRHIEISQSTETIAAMLAEHLPIAQVLVRQIDPARGCLETVAMGVALPAGPGATPAGNAPRRKWSSCSPGASWGRRFRAATQPPSWKRLCPPASRKMFWPVRFSFPTAAGPCWC